MGAYLERVRVQVGQPPEYIREYFRRRDFGKLSSLDVVLLKWDSSRDTIVSDKDDFDVISES